jgi:hypothetical protein
MDLALSRASTSFLHCFTIINQFSADVILMTWQFRSHSAASRRQRLVHQLTRLFFLVKFVGKNNKALKSKLTQALNKPARAQEQQILNLNEFKYYFIVCSFLC